MCCCKINKFLCTNVCNNLEISHSSVNVFKVININKINCFLLLTTGFATGSSKLGTLISNWEQMIFLLYKLINSVTVGTLTQVSKLLWTGNLMMYFFQLPENCFQLLSLRSFKVVETFSWQALLQNQLLPLHVLHLYECNISCAISFFHFCSKNSWNIGRPI